MGDPDSALSRPRSVAGIAIFAAAVFGLSLDLLAVGARGQAAALDVSGAAGAPLSAARADLSSAAWSVGGVSHVLAAGGVQGGVESTATDLFVDGVKRTPWAGKVLGSARQDMGAAAAGGVMAFVSGSRAGETVWDGAVDFYDVGAETFTHVPALVVGRSRLAASGSTRTDIIVAAGGIKAGGALENVVDVLNTTLKGLQTGAAPGTLSIARRWLRAATAVDGAKEWALIGGGFTNAAQTRVDVFDFTTLSVDATTREFGTARYVHGAAGTGPYAVFLGGTAGGTSVEIFDVTGASNPSQFTYSTTQISVTRVNTMAASLGPYVMVSGGNGRNTADVIDPATGTAWCGLTLAATVYDHTMAGAGDYALAMGGSGGGGTSVTVFQLGPTSSVNYCPGSSAPTTGSTTTTTTTSTTTSTSTTTTSTTTSTSTSTSTSSSATSSTSGTTTSSTSGTSSSAGSTSSSTSGSSSSTSTSSASVTTTGTEIKDTESSASEAEFPWYILVAAAGGCCCLVGILVVVIVVARRRRKSESGLESRRGQKRYNLDPMAAYDDEGGSESDENYNDAYDAITAMREVSDQPTYASMSGLVEAATVAAEDDYAALPSDSAMPALSGDYARIPKLLEFSDQVDVLVADEVFIDVSRKVGKGTFGDVFRGRYHDVDVAVKMLKNEYTDDQLRSFYDECEVIARVPLHEHIVGFLGATPSPFMILTEFCGQGSLLRYLRSAKTAGFSKEQQVKCIREISAGMCHLASHRIIHRDLAARNVLVTNELVCKIADFGLSKIMQEEGSQHHSNSSVGPVRWMAIETIKKGTYSERSDVWAFGVTAWEILSGGATPYGKTPPLEVARQVIGGRRLDFPDTLPETVTSQLESCFLVDPKKRPAFSAILQVLDDAASGGAIIYHTLNTFESLEPGTGLGSGLQQFRDQSFSSVSVDEYTAMDPVPPKNILPTHAPPPLARSVYQTPDVDSPIYNNTPSDPIYNTYTES